MLILLVEDNRQLAANIIEFLECEGISSDYASSGEQGLDLALSTHFDAIILDVTLPGIDGKEVCSELRRHSCSTPVLMLTARDTLDDKLSGFASGADDYLVKPFALAELEARIRVLVKRDRPVDQTLVLGELRANLEEHTVERDGRSIDLNPTSWRLLIALMHASPGIVSREQLEAILWDGEPPDSDALRSHIYLLRKAIDKPFDTQLIHTFRGVGVAIREKS